MRFWDSSALVPLFVTQPASARVASFLEDDEDVFVWALTDVEIGSAVARLEREGLLTPARAQEIDRDVETLLQRAMTIELAAKVKSRARRLVRSHTLRAADALQLGAALVACNDEPVGFEFVCIDARLADAARREGFTVRP